MKWKRRHTIWVCVIALICILLGIWMTPTENEWRMHRVQKAVDNHLFPEEQFTYRVEEGYSSTDEPYTICTTDYDGMQITFSGEHNGDLYAKFETPYGDDYILKISYCRDRFFVDINSYEDDFFSKDYVREGYVLDTNYELYDDSYTNLFIIPGYADNPIWYEHTMEYISDKEVRDYMERFETDIEILLDQAGA